MWNRHYVGDEAKLSYWKLSNNKDLEYQCCFEQGVIVSVTSIARYCEKWMIKWTEPNRWGLGRPPEAIIDGYVDNESLKVLGLDECREQVKTWGNIQVHFWEELPSWPKAKASSELLPESIDYGLVQGCSLRWIYVIWVRKKYKRG